MQKHKYNKRWHRRERLFNESIPVGVASWLFDASSLTRRLIQHCPGQFSVELIKQDICRPTLDEARTLNINIGRSALIREVLLHCDNKPVVYARTVIPLSTLTGAQSCYGSLGNRPLGAMLFSDRSMRRDAVEATRVNAGDALYRNIPTIPTASAPVWGRRSVFRVGGKPLLVCEFFLPTLFD